MASLISRLLNWIRSSIWPDMDEMQARIEALESELGLVLGLLTEDQVGIHSTLLGMASLDRAILLIDESGTALFTESNPGEVT